MTKSRALFLAASLAVLVPLVAGVLWSASDRRGADDGEDSLYKYLAIFSEVLGLVRNSYVDPTEVDRLLVGAMEGSTEALDAFSLYLPAAALERYRAAVDPAAPRSGLTVAKERGIAYVVAVEEGSPAAGAGFEAGDLLAEIDGRSTREMPTWELLTLVTGEAGAKRKCEVLRRGEPKELILEIGVFATASPRLEEVEGLPMLHLARFEPGTATAVRPLLTELTGRGASKLLIDLRGLAGGAPADAYPVAALFAEGALGSLREQGREVREFRGESAPLWSGELAVLVDSGTLGAAELLAVALRERAGAKLVGVRTFGWAGERSLIELAGGGRLHLTTGFYSGPDGQPISSGLVPDLLVDELQVRFGDRERKLRDLILERGVRYLRGEGGEAAVERAA